MIKSSTVRSLMASGAVILSLSAAQAQEGTSKVSAKTTVVPTATKVGGNVTISVKVIASAPFKGIVNVQVFDKAGKTAFQQIKENEVFKTGQTKIYAAKWKPTAKGAYQVKLGFFEPGWKKLVRWINDAGRVTVK